MVARSEIRTAMHISENNLKWNFKEVYDLICMKANTEPVVWRAVVYGNIVKTISSRIAEFMGVEIIIGNPISGTRPSVLHEIWVLEEHFFRRCLALAEDFHPLGLPSPLLRKTKWISHLYFAVFVWQGFLRLGGQPVAFLNDGRDMWREARTDKREAKSTQGITMNVKVVTNA